MGLADVTNPTAEEKVALLRDYGQRYGLRTLVETGLYMGGGSGMGCLDAFDRYIIFDCQPTNCAQAQVTVPRAEIHCGDSGDELPRWLADEPAVPTLFWLDAHGIDSDFPGFPAFPTLRELEAIARWPGARRSVVLIDDLRMFDDAGWPALVGAPTLEGLRAAVDAYTSLWLAFEEHDVMRLVPR